MGNKSFRLKAIDQPGLFKSSKERKPLNIMCSNLCIETD